MPNINSSNFRTEANKFLGKNIKVKNNSGIIGEIKIPRDYRFELSKFNDGITFKSPDGLTEIRVMNPITKPFNYPNGYIRKSKFTADRFGNINEQLLDINGKITTDRNLNHFNIVN